MILEFAGNHPWLAAWVAYLAFLVAVWPFRLVNRCIRHANIKAQGWPPAHLDADGDAIKNKDES